MPKIYPKDRTKDDLLVFVAFLREQASELEAVAKRMQEKEIATITVVSDKSMKNSIDSLLRFVRSTIAGLRGVEDARSDIQQLLDGTLPASKKKEKKPHSGGTKKSDAD